MWKSLWLTAALALASTGAHAAPRLPYSALPMHIGGQVADVGAGVKAYQWPGIYFEAQFEGPQVIVRFNDDANNFNIIVDGRTMMVAHKPGRTTINLDNLDTGPHRIRVEKRSETQRATGEFIGFAVPLAANVRPAPAARPRQIEFIGDSLTVGYGDTSAFGDCSGDDIFETTDTQEAYGPLLAKHYDADYRIEAYSGAGMTRNSGGRTPDFHVTDLIGRPVLDHPGSDPAPWAPQIVVVNLGGNDFNAPLHDGEAWSDTTTLILDYRAKYATFVKTLRTRYPKAEILLSTTTDKISFLPATVDTIFADLKADGVTGIDRINWPAMARTGCDKHPNIRDHAVVAQLYIDYIDHHPELWHGH